MTPILIIDDEQPIRRVIRLCLEKAGYAVLEAAEGAEGLYQFGGARPGLVILDLGLPDMDGAEVLAAIRSRGDTPVIILSARDAESDVTGLLDAGADDYITKPFGTAELLARVRVALRHSLPPEAENRPLRIGALDVRVDSREAFREGTEEKLTPTEWALLLALLKKPGKILTRNQLIQAVWGPALQGDYNNLRVTINQLRKKLEVDPAAPTALVTEPGVGYRLRVEAE